MAPARSILWLLIGATTVLTAASACDQSDDVEVSVDSRRSAIVGGSAATSSVYNSTVALVTGTYPNLVEFCSGVLVAVQSSPARSKILTAGHCMFDSGAQRLPSDFRIYFGTNTNTSPGTTYAVSSFTAHPSYNDFTLANDLAKVYIAQAVPSSVATPTPPLSGCTLNLGTTLDIVGFGVNHTGERRHVLGTFTQREPVNLLDFVSMYTGSCYGDSGGPGLYYGSGSGSGSCGGGISVAGITSSGKCAADPFAPEGIRVPHYEDVEVAPYAPWIALWN